MPFRFFRARSAHRKSRLVKHRPITLEPLESRQLLSVNVSLQNGALRISGTPGDDQVFIMPGAGDLVVFANGSTTRWSKSEVQRIEAFGGDGNDLLMAIPGLDIPTLLDGGPGNDSLQGGTGHDTLRGGDGNDLIYGTAGSNMIEGGTGNDTLIGGTGNDRLTAGSGQNLLRGVAGNNTLTGGSGADILVGGSGEDLLLAGGGRNLLIGGGGRDELYGQNGDNILIGGYTDYDDNDQALKAILEIWSMPVSYESRISLLENHSFAYHLQSNHTVHDDVAIDHLYGGSGQDWFFLPGVVPVHAHGAGHQHAPAADSAPWPADVIANLDVIVGRSGNEQINSDLPHADNPVLRNEHLAVFALVHYDQVTHTAVQSGAWTNPATWADGVVPASSARVLIPQGVTVTVNAVIEPQFTTLRVDGTLRFHPAVNTELRVDTLVVDPRGTFQMGTAVQPIATGVTARVVFADLGAIDRVWDPHGLSRGMIMHGTASIHGAQTTSFLPLAVAPSAGDTQLILKEVPVNWKVGDQIVVAGTTRIAEDDELRTILAINGNVVTIEPLTYDHHVLRPDLEVHVAHLTRNVVFESENSAIERRGHIMFMHTRNVDIGYAGFYELGRHDKRIPVNDSQFDEQGQLIPGTGENPRGRYSVHFHRNGVHNDGNPARVHGSVVMDNPGWGYVNHSSFVEFTDNVAFDVSGAAFVTEAGDEIGTFARNIAIHSIGSGTSINGRHQLQDFGHQGDGFWIQGPGAEVIDNVAVGHSGNGFAFFTQGLTQAGLGTTVFPTANLADPSIAAGADFVDVGHVPITLGRNIAYASTVGANLRFHLLGALHDQRSVVEDLVLWGNQNGMNLFYTNQTIVRNTQILSDLYHLSGVGIGRNDQTQNITYQNLTVEGFNTGIAMPFHGHNVIDGGYFNNLENIHIRTVNGGDRSITLTDQIVFGELPRSNREQLMIVMEASLAPIHKSIDHLFYADQTILIGAPLAGLQFFYAEQAGDYVPFPQAGPYIPAAYVGKTNQQLWDEFGIALGGQIAPASAFTVGGVRGLIALLP